MKSNTTLFSIGRVAEKVGLQRWKLAHLIETGKVPPPTYDLPGRRVFTAEDVEAIAAALSGSTEPVAEPASEIEEATSQPIAQ